MSEMETKNLRYIVFLIDVKHKQHDGGIFPTIQEAKSYALDIIKDPWETDKFIIGTFYMDPNYPRMDIEMIESHGFKGDKKNPEQLTLFNPDDKRTF